MNRRRTDRGSFNWSVAIMLLAMAGFWTGLLQAAQCIRPMPPSCTDRTPGGYCANAWADYNAALARYLECMEGKR